MSGQQLDVVGIGNAIVDVLSHAEDGFLSRFDLVKGTMKLVSAAEGEAIYRQMGPTVETSGGSAANTIAGVAALGGTAGFIGKVRDDELGRIFRHDIVSLGVEFPTMPAADGESTARCLILVTSDAQRTMQTFLGASSGLTPSDVDDGLVARAKITYLEGYLWDPPQAKQAFLKAAKVAHDADREVALSLSDPFCVERHRAEFRDLVANHIDVLFANEAEITSLYQVKSFDDALQAVRGQCKVAVLTRSEKGAVIFANGEVHVIDAVKVPKIVDTTGAGDLYAAGFLHGYTSGRPMGVCGRMGAACAAEIIGHFGARPESDLKSLICDFK